MVAGSIAGPAAAAKISGIVKSRYSTDEEPNSFEDITKRNNFYELGRGKTDAATNSGRLTTSPWSVEIDGLVGRPGAYAFEDIVNGVAMEERILRASLRRGMVHGDSLGWVPACHSSKES